MTLQDVLQVILLFAVLIALTPFLGNYMAKVFTGENHFMLPLFGRLEKLIYRFIRVDPAEESNWKSYTFGLLLFNLADSFSCS